MSRQTCFARFVITAAAVLLASSGSLVPRAAGQTLYGSLVGNVTDPSGAAVPSVKVTAANAATGFVREVTANERGAYLFTDLQAGSYDVQITAASFAGFIQRGVPVSINAVVRVDVQLQLATTAETITVTGMGATLQTDRSDLRAEISGREYRDLPVPGARNYQALFKLVPGFTPPRRQNSIVSNAPGRPGGERQRDHEEHQQHAHRRREQRPHLAAAAFGLHAAARSHRHRQRGHQQHGRRTGTRRRRRHQRQHEVRHQRLPRRGVQVPPEQRD